MLRYKNKVHLIKKHQFYFSTFMYTYFNLFLYNNTKIGVCVSLFVFFFKLVVLIFVLI